MLLSGRDVRLDPWAVEYGAEAPGLTTVDDADEQVEVAVETSTWREIRPASAVPVRPLAFIDGVRRIEARLVINTESRMVHGAIGSHAVGAVHVNDAHARFGEHRIGRELIFASGEHPGTSISLGPGLTYEPRSVAEEDPDAPLRGLHAAMRQSEERFANQLSSGSSLVIADGPLNISQPGGGPVVGFVKRLFRLYVPVEQLGIVRTLSAGSRSPVFLIRSAGRFSRYSWFVRLAAPLRMESEFTGIVRLEVTETVGADAAIALANEITGWLPRFVPSRTRDPRAPQNLVPIGALEQHLRRLLGDQRLIHRRVAALLDSETAHV